MSGTVPASSAATDLAFMSWTAYCDSSTFTPLFCSYFLIAA